METLRDERGNRIGYLAVEGNLIVLRDKNQVRLGTYDLGQDITRNKQGTRIGSGNQLMRLLTTV